MDDQTLVGNLYLPLGTSQVVDVNYPDRRIDHINPQRMTNSLWTMYEV